MPISEVYNCNFRYHTKEIPDKFYDLLIADPPYGIKESAHRNISRSKLAKTKIYKKELWDQDIPTQDDFDELFRISKNQIIFGINYFLGKRNIPFSAGRIVWDKINGDSNFSDCELAYCSFHHSTRIFRFMWNGMMQGTPGNGSKMNAKKGTKQIRIHPTEKPTDIYKWILKRYARIGQKIIDPYMGSGRSRIAAYEFGVDYTGIEIDVDYFDDSCKLFEYYKAQLKLLFPL
jgi:site-specific DNA-methyltransferase (adenine-specific)